jgi:hypothetical protein
VIHVPAQRPRSIAVLYDHEAALVLRAIDDLACLALGVFPPGCNVEQMDARAREAAGFADQLAARLADRDAAREHHRAVMYLRARIDLIAGGGSRM